MVREKQPALVCINRTKNIFQGVPHTQFIRSYPEARVKVSISLLQIIFVTKGV